MLVKCGGNCPRKDIEYGLIESFLKKMGFNFGFAGFSIQDVKRGVGNKWTFEKFLSTVVHRLGNHLSQPKSCIPIVKIRFLILAGERAKVREIVNEKSV